MALTTRHQALAWDLIEGLDDKAHKGIYFRLAKIYDETFLRQILSLVKEKHRDGRIKGKDRGRYFMGILKKELEKYGKDIKNHPRRRSDSAPKSRVGAKSKKS